MHIPQTIQMCFTQKIPLYMSIFFSLVIVSLANHVLAVLEIARSIQLYSMIINFNNVANE